LLFTDETLTNVSLGQGLIVHYKFQNFSTCVKKAHHSQNEPSILYVRIFMTSFR